MRKRNKFEAFLATAKGQRYINYIYSFGAAIVILGAMFKIIHVSGGNILLAVGMITEALVFIFSAFDPTMAGAPLEQDDKNKAAISNGGIVVVGSAGNDAVQRNDNSIPLSANQKATARQTVIVGGGGAVVSGAGSTAFSSGGKQSTNTVNHQQFSEQTFVSQSSGNQQQQASATPPISLEAADELTHVSSSLLNSYKKMADEAASVTTGNDGFAENVRLLNENIKRLNHVLESQLSSVDGQTSMSKYINDSLENIKSIYDGAIADSYAFKRETEKMTRQIEALNRVYARLLQAMTTNNNNSAY